MVLCHLFTGGSSGYTIEASFNVLFYSSRIVGYLSRIGDGNFNLSFVLILIESPKDSSSSVIDSSAFISSSPFGSNATDLVFLDIETLFLVKTGIDGLDYFWYRPI